MKAKQMREIIITGLPPEKGEIKGCWYNGYPVHQGYSESSLNYATVLARKKGIVPDQGELRYEWQNLVFTLQNAGFLVHIIPFPDQLNQPDCICHDAVFVRDSGMMFGKYWIQGRFAAEARGEEAHVYGQVIPKLFGKELITLPEGAFLEFGEVFYLEIEHESYYFGGLSRSNEKAHQFVREIVQPDHFYLIESEGYHLDTVFTPVLGPDNRLAALILCPEMIMPESLELLESIETEIIPIDPIDSSGQGEVLGDYAVNALVAPGILISCCPFQTTGVEHRLQEMGIHHYEVPLEYFKYAGGSVHCLTNEVYR